MGTQSRRVVHEKPAPRVASEVKVIPLFWYLSSHRFRRTRLQNRPRQTRGMWLWGAEVVVQRLTVRVCATLGRRRRDSGSGRGLHTQQRGMSARLKTTHAGRGGAKRRSQGFRFKKLCVDKQHGGSQRWIFLTIIPITLGRGCVACSTHAGAGWNAYLDSPPPERSTVKVTANLRQTMRATRAGGNYLFNTPQERQREYLNQHLQATA